MKIIDIKTKKISIFAILFALSFGAASPVFATDTVIFKGGVSNGAEISDLGGANINSITSNSAQIGINGNGNTITWNYLNVVHGNSLDFNFTANGQVALNNVVNGMSTFGGSLTSSGAAGRIIIANPNGILFENGAYTNCNALTLTTQNVNWDGQKFGQVALTDSGSLAGIKIGQGFTKSRPAPIFRIAQDLNIVSPQITIDGADILAGENVRLITADGVTFFAEDAGNHNFDYSSLAAAEGSDKGLLIIKKANIAVANSSNGKVYLIAKNDIQMNNSTITADLTVKTPGNILLSNSNISGDLSAESLASSSRTIAVSPRSTTTTETLERKNITLDKVNVGGKIEATANSINIFNSTAKNLNLNAVANYKTIATEYRMGLQNTMTTTQSGGDIYLDNVVAKDSTEYSVLSAANDINIVNNSNILGNLIAEAKNITLDNSQAGSLNASASEIFSIVNGSKIGDITANASFIEVDNSTMLNTDLTSDNGILINNSSLANTNIATGGDVDITDSSIGGNLAISTSGNATLAGIYVGNDLAISNAASVLISNSLSPAASDRPLISSLVSGLTSLTDYNTGRFNVSHFNDTVSGVGAGNISYIGGNVSISNVNDAKIVNSAIIGNVNVSNVTTDADLITSYVGGSFNPDRSTVGGDVSVFKSYIRGSYTNYYANNAENVKDDVNRLGYGDQLNAVFEKQFMSKSFAAADDQIKYLKSGTMTSVVKGKNNSIVVQKAFRAY